MELFNNNSDFFNLARDAHQRGEYAKALALLRRGAATWRGCKACYAWLGAYYHKGYGIERDLYQAMCWYERAMNESPRSDKSSWIVERYNALKALNPTPKPMPTVVNDYLIGRIELSRTAPKNDFKVQFTDNSLKIIYNEAHLFDAPIIWAWYRINNYFAKYSEDNLPEVIDEHFSRTYDHFELRIERGRGERYSHRNEGKCYTLIIPATARCEELVTRKAILRHSMSLMRQEAQSYLERRCREISEKTGLRYTKFKLGVGTDRLGFYTECGEMTISWHTIKYPHIYTDSVIYHELCHSLHLDHSTRFYNALFRYGGEEIHRADCEIFRKNKVSKSI